MRLNFVSNHISFLSHSKFEQWAEIRPGMLGVCSGDMGGLEKMRKVIRPETTGRRTDYEYEQRGRKSREEAVTIVQDT
jgi:hypothetical protein